MLTLRFSLIFLLLLCSSVCLTQQAGTAAKHQTNSCAWVDVVPDVVRTPIQMDVHAAYRLFVFKSDGTIGYRVRARYPFAAFLSFTTYMGSDGLLYQALLDYKINPDSDSVNPFREHEPVNTRNRSYSVTVLPESTSTDWSMPNPIYMPPRPRGSDLVTVVLVQRIYLPEPQVHDRFGGVESPTIEPFLVSTPWIPASCPNEDFSSITDQFGSFAPGFSQSPLPRAGKIEFYRPPVSQVPYADGSGQLTEHDCTGYLMGTVFGDQVAVIHFPAMPDFFDNTNITRKTTFHNQTVRYLSMGSYGATPLEASEGENLAGPDIKLLPDGSAKFVAIPYRLPDSIQQAIRERAAELGYNVLPLAEGEPHPINPFLIYRNKVAQPGFVGDIQNVSCFHGSDFSQAPSHYAASTVNMGPFAPVGIECSIEEFLYGGCGQ